MNFGYVTVNGVNSNDGNDFAFVYEYFIFNYEYNMLQ